MYYELYIDVFFLANFMMDYILLLLVKQMLRCSATYGRICLGAMLGSFLTCIIVVLPIPYVFIKFILFHMFVNTCMIRAGLKIKTRTSFARAYFLLYVGGFLLGGILQMVQSYVRIGSLFFAIAIVGYFAVSKIWDIISGLQKVASYECEVELYLEDRHIIVKGLWDTGNRLCDSLTGQPVHILNRKEAKLLFAGEELKKIRYISYHSIGKKTGVLPVLQIDRMHIQGKEEYWIEAPLIGISEENVSYEGEYKLILNPNAF